MSVSGDNNGIPRGNLSMNRVEPLVTVEKLKSTYLFGITIKDEDGKELSKEAYQQYINNAVSMLEHYLDIYITPCIGFVEDKDYYRNDYSDWGYLHLSNYPVIRVQKVEQVYFRDEQGQPEILQEIPNNWVRLNSHHGTIRLIPNARFPASLQIDQYGSYFPEVMRTDMVPHLWRITYDYGFDHGKIPTMVNYAIGLIASVQAFIVGGGLVLGAGIASSSISLDGLSQSINTTQSAENHAYSAQMKNFMDQLYGKNKEDPFALLTILRNYYKGDSLELL